MTRQGHPQRLESRQAAIYSDCQLQNYSPTMPHPSAPLCRDRGARVELGGVVWGLLVWLLLSGVTQGAFLEEALPLAIDATIPGRLSRRNNDEPVRFFGTSTITVVFSRAVLALGATFGEEDIPDAFVPFQFADPELLRGRGRWVTTSVFRWDPQGEWPTDVETELVWNADLTTYDGVKLNLTNVRRRVAIDTPPLRLTLIGVGSTQALRLTDEHWDARMGVEDDNLPEVPPDGALVIEFSRQIRLPSLESQLQVVRYGGSGRRQIDTQIRVRTCIDLNVTLVNDEGEDLLADCAIVDFVGGLEIDRDIQHGLIIPPGWEYNPGVDGSLREEIEIEFYGLRRFRFPFSPFFDQPGSRSDVPTQTAFSYINGANLTLWLPHGLAEGVKVEDLKSTLILQQFPWDAPGTWIELDFDLVLGDRGTLFLLADLEPVERYKILALSNDEIKDGFGLPFEGGEVEFTTSRLVGAMLFVTPILETVSFVPAIFPDATDPGWNGEIPFFVRSPQIHGNATIHGWSLLPANNRELRRLGYSLLVPFQRDDIMDLTLGRDPILAVDLAPQTRNVPSVTPIPLGPSVEASRGTLLLEAPTTSGGDSRAYTLVRSKDFHFAAVGIGSRNRDQQFGFDVVFLVTSAASGAPLSDVKITVLRREDISFRALSDDDERDLEIVEELTTDRDGAATFRSPPCEFVSRCGQILYWVETGTVSAFFQDRYSYYNQETFGYSTAETLVLDRRLVEPGDTLHVAGFMVSREDSVEVRAFGQNPQDEAPTLYISPPFDPSLEDFERMEFPIAVNADYGTFQLEIEVPNNAPRREYFVQSPFNERFVVGEPRVLTADVILTVPAWVRPNGSVEVEVLIASLLDIPIADAEFSLTWRSAETDLQERVELSTNATGQATYTLDLSEAEEVIRTGDTINLELEYIGPTREPIFRQASLAVAVSPLWLSVDTSLDMPLPTITEFGVKVDVFSREGPPGVHEIQVELLDIEDALDAEIYRQRYRRLQLRQDEGIVLDVVDRCELVSNQSDYEMFSQCRFVLPDIGHYFIRACLRDRSATVCGVESLGRNLTEWEFNTLNAHPGLDLIPSSQSIPRNGEAEFVIELPFDDVKGVVLWGNELRSKHQLLSFRKAGLHRITIQTQEECLGGCSVRAAFLMPRQNFTLDIDLPTDFKFGINLPTSYTDSAEIEIEDEEMPFTLDVQMEAAQSIVAPGSNTTLEIMVQKCAGNPNLVSPESCSEMVPARDVEVVLIGVDKAYLLLELNPLKGLVEELDLDWETELLSTVLGNQWLSAAYGEKVLELLLQVHELDPWQLSRLFAGGFDVRELAFSFSQMLDDYRQSQAVTEPPPGLSRILAWFGRELQQAPDPLPMPSGRSPETEEASDDPDLRLQTEFEVTPLFTVIKTDEEGKAAVNFTAPDNVGTFVLRAYASSLDAQHGATELEIINRLPLTLTPSAPRFVRIGDEFEAGVIVTVAGDEREGIPMTVTLLGDPSEDLSIIFAQEDTSEEAVVDEDCDEEDLSCLVVLDRQEFVSDADGQVEVRFEFSAERLGDGNIAIRADTADDSDALQLTVPVFAQQEPVFLATSFSINPEETAAETQEGLELPEAVPGTGTVDLLAGVGSFPAVLDIAERFLTDEPGRTAPGALGNISLPLILQGYGVDASQSGRPLFARAVRAFDMGMDNLNEGNLTEFETGLQWFVPFSFSFNNRVNVRLNAHALHIASSLLSGLSTENRRLRRGINRLEGLVEIWREAMIRQFITDAQNVLEAGFTPSQRTTLLVLQALGADYEVPVCPARGPCARERNAEQLTLAAMLDDFNEGDLTFEEGVILALILLESEGRAANERPEVQTVLDELFDRIRVIGRTAYIAASPSTSTPASSLLQVEALRVFVLSGRALNDPLIPRLVTYLTSDDVGSSVFFSRSTIVDTLTLFALSEYDQLTGSSDPDLTLEVNSGSLTLLEAEFMDVSDSVVNASVSFDELDDPPAPLVFRSEGTGEVTLVASLDFIPAELLPFPTYRGLYVERIVRESDADGDPIGPPLMTIPLASSVIITLQITTPDELDEVTVRALMPGGLEPIDPLVTESSLSRTTCVLDGLNIGFRLWFWPLCPRQVSYLAASSLEVLCLQETRPSEVTFTYDRLRGGTHGIHFRAVAASVGTWILPPVHAFVTSQPEVMGLSVAGEFTVCDGRNCRAQPITEEPAVPQDCPENCSGTGLCDVTTGECQCDTGYVGEDCGRIEAT